MELIIILGWLLSLTIVEKTTPIQSAYSLCANSVPCICARDIENRLIVDCSKLNLMEIPRMPDDTVFLSLSDNEIKVVEKGTFSNLPHLLSLDLSNNYVRKIDRDGFIELKNLRRLDLNQNNVPLIAKCFEPGVFRSQKNLCYLNIQSVHSTIGNFSYPDETFAELISLTTLQIYGKPNAIFGPGFSKLPNLRILKLSSDKCNMEAVFNNTFVNLPFLTDLDISYCSFSMIEPGALTPLRHLRYLDISNNFALGLYGLRNASFGLINGSITVLTANKLYPKVHLSVQLNIEHLKFLNQTNIKELYLDENQIELIESGCDIVCPKTLETLSVMGNKFAFGYISFHIDSCNSLKTFYGGYQHTTYIPHKNKSETQYVGRPIADFSLVTDSESCKHDINRIICIDKNEKHIWDFV